ncbi:hypothetical protein ACFVTE_11800 [Arthrobacter sp. NPDC058097]|uniref:hypothetical protein n=1 Tax=Arthrobacter sp. NPDC058097 TaxID=3346340 RepID=UPI0036DDF81F
MSDSRGLVVGIAKYAIKGLKNLGGCAEGAPAIAKLPATYRDQTIIWPGGAVRG